MAVSAPPIVANLLEQAGTSRYAPDLSGKPAEVLTGFILNSPLVDYNSNCDMLYSTMNTGTSRSTCAGYIPAYAMTADYFTKSTKRGNKSQEQYLDELRQFTRDTYLKTQAQYFDKATFEPTSAWTTFTASDKGKTVLDSLASYTGIPATTWNVNYNLAPDVFRGTLAGTSTIGTAVASAKSKLKSLGYSDLVINSYIYSELTAEGGQYIAQHLGEDGLLSGFELGRYDARMKVPANNAFPADNYIDVAFKKQAQTYFPEYINYKSKSDYNLVNDDTIGNWKFARSSQDKVLPQSISDIQGVLMSNPNEKMLILHGYEDVATPGFQTELDLEGVNLQKRIPVKWFEGGHMTYNTESSRAPLKATINKFYETPAGVYLNEANPPTASATGAETQLISAAR